MANHHFIAQTYLKHFGDPSKEGMLHAYRKSGGKGFRCRPRDVCHEWDGDLNPTWLKDPALLGQFRSIFEPHWNASVETLLSKNLDPHGKLAVSGYMANLMTCTPAWRRVCVTVRSDHAAADLSFAKQMKEKHGGYPDLPVEAIAMMEKGHIRLDIDPGFIKAVTTRQLLQHAWQTYHQDWVIIDNPTDHPFITSDNPVAILQYENLSDLPARYLAITPRLCLAVKYGRAAVPPFDPRLAPMGKAKWRTAEPKEAKRINKLVAQCAEDLVFASTSSAGVASLVRNCARYRVEAKFVKLPAGEPDAVYHGSIIRVCEKPAMS